ncbi:MAG: hypothetical protein RR403_04970 [Pseudoflavonifractor sp.]
MAAGKEHKSAGWYRLDNAGVLYSAIQRDQYSAVYRISAVMTRPVDPAALQRAVDRSMPRFPSFRVKLKTGFFWSYFEPNDNPGPFVKQDMANPCQPIRDKSDNGWLVRFFYYRNRISFEAFHAISDGAGAMIFFRTILAEYLRQLGETIPCGDCILDVNDPPRREEIEDSYGKYAGGKVRRGGLQKTAYPNTSPPEPFYTLNVTMGFLPVDKLKTVAKSHGASITEYLAAVMLESILQNQQAEHLKHEKPVALAIPINLRPWFQSETLRNFIITIRPCIDPSLGEYSFQEIVNYVHNFMRLNVDPKLMRSAFTGNVRFTTNKILQLIPVFLKNPVMAFSYKLVGVRPFSGTYTNPGPVTVPPEMQPHIHHMEVILGQATRPSPHCASISYGNIMEITFAGTGTATDTERNFFRHLVREGIPVKVESNRGN